MTEKPEKQAKYEYLDLLMSALTDHEQKLNTLIEKLNKTFEKLLVNLEPLQQAEHQQKTKENDLSKEELTTLLETARNVL